MRYTNVIAAANGLILLAICCGCAVEPPGPDPLATADQKRIADAVNGVLELAAEQDREH
jgi:hypothetical protein